MPLRLTLTGLASQYIHMPLAPFCLKKAMEDAALPVDVTICDLIEQYTGVSISFLEWMIAGVPIYLISLIFICWWLPKAFKPEQMTDEQYNEFVKYLDSTPKQFNAQDKKFIVPIYSVEARRVKKDQDPYLIMAQTSPSGNTRIIGRYPNKEAALTEMKNLAEAINLSTVNRTKFYEIK